ncbi:hypothetical protein TNCV_832671 [Trichonephila clavipes]|nr:hypothetical protein TNCV_832671 [Trichonephila clavipes]
MEPHWAENRLTERLVINVMFQSNISTFGDGPLNFEPLQVTRTTSELASETYTKAGCRGIGVATNGLGGAVYRYP